LGKDEMVLRWVELMRKMEGVRMVVVVVVAEIVKVQRRS
jgi:hypothetical protein